jgi:hypothetical protein
MTSPRHVVPIFVLVALPAAVAHAAAPAWVQKSDANAAVLLARTAPFEPEEASRLGLEGFDDRVVDLGPRHLERYRKAVAEAIAELEKRRAGERDRAVLEDLEIIVKGARDQIRKRELDEKYLLPYFSLERLIFDGLHVLLDDQVDPERRAIAVARLRRYAGLEPGATPLATLAEARVRERLGDATLLPPVKARLEKDLATAPAMMHGIEELFGKYQLTGWNEPFAKLKRQLAAWNDFVRRELLPKARADFRLPAELYAFRLHQNGVDIAPAELTVMAHAAFDDLQRQMQALAPKVAAARKLGANDYRSVLKALRQEQLVGPAIVPHYTERLHQMEQIIREHHLVTLPLRPARIRLASDAESAELPAPHMQPPRLIHNTGEQGEFILPLTVPAPPGSKEASQKLDDFTHAAASWTLTAHEARPGHELQFDAMVERGVSLARAVFAFNSSNVEGWGLYAESIALPYMPAEGQLVSLQFRLHRAARAFLDPELQAGKITPAQAKKVLTDDVGLSEGMANSELERYTFWTPGQATSYFYGYSRLVSLRREVEQRLGAKFDAQRLHDLLLAEGVLPPELLRKAVLEKLAPTK